MSQTMTPSQAIKPPVDAELSGPISSQPIGAISQQTTATGEQGTQTPGPSGLGITPAQTATAPYTGGAVSSSGAASGGASSALAQQIATAISLGLAQAPTNAAGWAQLADYYSTSAGQNQITTAEASTPTTPSATATPTPAIAGTASSAPASGGGSQSQWAAQTLAAAGLPQTQNNVENMMRWMTAEEPTSNWSNRNNPLNASLNTGTVDGTGAYASLATGAQNTAAMIKQSNMSMIYQALAANAPASEFSAAVVASPWASSHYGGDPNHIASIPVPGGSAGPVAPFSQTAAAGAPGSSNNITKIAQAQIGTPYVWGGEDPNAPGHPGAFDCSGLVQWVYGQAGTALPRVAQAQYNATAKVANNTTLQPGDLLFFGSGPNGIEHVGIYIGNNQMIDAPHTGADVRVDQNPTSWANYVGATRPVDPTGATTAATGPAAATASNSQQQYGQILQQVTQSLGQLSGQYPGMFDQTETVMP